jgi:hypothetical protein
MVTARVRFTDEEQHLNAVALEHHVEHFSAPMIFFTIRKDRINDVLFELIWMMMRPR